MGVVCWAFLLVGAPTGLGCGWVPQPSWWVVSGVWLEGEGPRAGQLRRAYWSTAAALRLVSSSRPALAPLPAAESQSGDWGDAGGEEGVDQGFFD